MTWFLAPEDFQAFLVPLVCPSKQVLSPNVILRVDWPAPLSVPPEAKLIPAGVCESQAVESWSASSISHR